MEIKSITTPNSPRQRSLSKGSSKGQSNNGSYDPNLQENVRIDGFNVILKDDKMALQKQRIILPKGIINFHAS